MSHDDEEMMFMTSSRYASHLPISHCRVSTKLFSLNELLQDPRVALADALGFDMSCRPLRARQGKKSHIAPRVIIEGVQADAL